MMSLLKSRLSFRHLPGLRCYCDLRRQHPFYKTLDVLSIPLPFFLRNKEQSRNRNIEHADVVIIGAGSIGASAAYWLKMKAGKGLSIAVIDKDLTFKNKLEYLSMGGMNQHYSLMENILLSQFTSEFLRTVKDSLGPTVDLKFVPNRNLVMANEKYAELLEHNITIQKENGIRNEKLLPSKLKARYPWLNVDDIQLGCIGLEFEGWFDSNALHYGFLSKSVELGAQYIEGEVKEFRMVLQRDMLMEGVKQGTYQKMNELIYTTPDAVESSIKFAACILAAGPDSKEISELAEIGKGSDLLMVPLPVERRYNRVYCIENANSSQIGINMPMVKDVNGTWIRRNGIQNNYICGHTPLVPTKTYDELSDEEYFTNVIQASLARRIPCLKDSKVLLTKKEVCDYSTFDESGYIGIHPYYNNMILANGFGNLGVVHSPGLGRAAAELIIDSKFVTIDLTRFCFDRLLTVDPVVEVNCY